MSQNLQNIVPPHFTQQHRPHHIKPNQNLKNQKIHMDIKLISNHRYGGIRGRIFSGNISIHVKKRKMLEFQKPHHPRPHHFTIWKNHLTHTRIQINTNHSTWRGQTSICSSQLTTTLTKFYLKIICTCILGGINRQ